MKFSLFLLLVLAVFICSCREETNLAIKPFFAQNELGKSNEGTKSIYFLVRGYTGKESEYQAIESHVCTVNRDSLDRIYKQYWLNYYRESKKTNNSNIRQNPKDFFTYSTMEDIIAQYSFIADSIVGRHKHYLQEYPKESSHLKEYEICD